jgi:hypothetical protein
LPNKQESTVDSHQDTDTPNRNAEAIKSKVIGKSRRRSVISDIVAASKSAGDPELVGDVPMGKH